MKVIRMHDYMTYAPKDAKPNVQALRRIMYFVLRRNRSGSSRSACSSSAAISAWNKIRPPQRASVTLPASCKGQCIRKADNYAETYRH